MALNRLWGTGLSEDELAGLGLRLGADVPVFVRGRAAWAEGVGERLVAVDLPQPWYLVLVPPCQVSTAAVFKDPELTRNSRVITIADFLAGAGGNDCEPVVRCRYPAVAEALDWLGQFGSAHLTGTGACVFAAFDTEVAARALLTQAVVVGVILGAVPVTLIQLLTGNIFGIVFQILYLVIAVPTVYARLSGIQLFR